MLAPESGLPTLTIGRAEQQHSAWPEYTADFGQRANRVRHVLNHIPHSHNVEESRGQAQSTGLTAQHTDCLTTCYGESTLVDVYSDPLPSTTSTKLVEEEASSAAQVEYLPSSWSDTTNRPTSDRPVTAAHPTQ